MIAARLQQHITDSARLARCAKYRSISMSIERLENLNVRLIRKPQAELQLSRTSNRQGEHWLTIELLGCATK
jgi:hypothetical protein